MKPPWAALPLNSEQHTCHWTVNLVVFWYFLSYSELCHVIFLYVVVPSYPQFQLSLVSVTQGQPQSENIKWTILEIIHKFYIACQSEHDEISSCLLCPVQDGNHLFVEYPSCIHYLPLRHLVAISVIRSTIVVSQCSYLSNPYFT